MQFILIIYNIDTYMNITFQNVSDFDFPPILDVDLLRELGQQILNRLVAEFLQILALEIVDQSQILISADAQYTKTW